MSSGSKPVTTIGARYFAASGSYSVKPMMVHTWPAARNPWTRLPSAERIASIAGGTRTWDTSMEKFGTSCRAAWNTAIALAGAVVSKPTAKNTTSLSGSCLASSTASSGE